MIAWFFVSFGTIYISMPKALTVSIIIPVYNEASWLKECLQAIQKQTVTPLEVIVVDNNSTDGSLAIAKRFAGVTVLQEKRQGALYARTAGFNAARGDIIGRIDADTRIEPNWVERLQELMIDKKVAAVTGSSHWYDMPLSPFNHWVEDLFKNALFRHEKNFPFLFGTNMAIRRSAWRSIKSELCDKAYIFEDADLAIHLFQDKQQLLYDIRLRAGMSARRYSDTPRAFLRYIRLQSVTYKQHGIHTIGSSIAVVTYIVGYIILRPLSLAYDADAKRFSLKKLLFNRNQPRRHPFD